MAWKRPTSPVAKKFITQPPAAKIILAFVWNMKDAIWVHFTTKGPDLAPKRFPYV